MPFQGHSDLYLTDISPSDKPWDAHRKNSYIVQTLYQQIGYGRYADRIKDCSRELAFVFDSEDREEFKLRFKSAKFCRLRHCPTCQWRRSLKWRARLFEAVPRLVKDYPKARFLFLTLTVKNCPLDDLRETVKHLNKSWIRLSQRSQFPAIGWLKAVEVTRDKNGDAHPHLHAILIVPPSYFGNNYLNKEKWVKLWAESLRVDYLPSVHIATVKAKRDTEGDLENAAIMRAILETMKYSVKEDDLISDPIWLEGITKQLYKMRAVSVGGILRNYLDDSEPEPDQEIDQEATESDIEIWFGFNEMLGRYLKVQK